LFDFLILFLVFCFGGLGIVIPTLNIENEKEIKNALIWIISICAFLAFACCKAN